MDIYKTGLTPASQAVKDLAVATVACCSNSDDVFIDIEDINDGYRELPTEDFKNAKELREVVQEAVDEGVKMLHLI